MPPTTINQSKRCYFNIEEEIWSVNNCIIIFKMHQKYSSSTKIDNIENQIKKIHFSAQQKRCALCAVSLAY